ncbi:putative peptidase [Novipirellula galeiformis]|uniref:Putative peptidase n=1 Tax=Novipirellula galeiformis TaxID=2528004 RepID=A0A5C6CIE5_9BACT|nr:Xaa-Pro peptidase family protein [Novipirellula galeiformis]TWU24062.1 putative peptidase [Novipirellula galeiformis]
MAQRLDTLQQSLSSLEIDAMLVIDEINVRYLSGFTGDSSYLLVAPSETTILSDGRYEIQIASECPSLSPVIRPPSQLMLDLLQQVLSDSQYRRIGIESSVVSLAQYRALAAKCPEITWVETAGVVEKQRMIKDESEIQTTREAVSIAQRSFQAILPMLSPKWTERAIAHELEAKMRFLGADSASFKPIVAFDAAGALPHYQPAEIFLPKSGTILIDWGANYRGYASDITRTLWSGKISSEFERAYETVLAAQLAAIAAIRPGVQANKVDLVARDVIQKAGLGAKFNHSLGHGIGLQIHESPRMSSNCEDVLAAGMIVTVEPGVYIGNEFGIRIEDDVLVTNSGCEVLTTLAKGLDDCRLVL